jgi:hypothetical protein
MGSRNEVAGRCSRADKQDFPRMYFGARPYTFSFTRNGLVLVRREGGACPQ